MKFNIYILTAGIAALFLINSCSKDALDYRDYLKDAEKIYPGLPKQIQAAPGYHRVTLSWHPSPDPTVTKYRIFWNNGADSVEFSSNNHNPAEMISKMIENLNEYDYSFTVYSYDSKGNRSVPVLINNVKVYGESYTASLTNRFLSVTNPYDLGSDGLTLNFEKADSINVATEIKYTLNDNSTKSLTIDSSVFSVYLANYKSGTPVLYRSSYKPVSNAIDVFTAVDYSTVPNIIIPLDKSIFKEVHVTNDVGTYSGETSLSQMWNGNSSPTAYPDIFHSDGSHPLPHQLTFDLGKVYNSLAQFEIIGRDCCNNPVRFEIWGVSVLDASTITMTPPNVAGWSQEMEGRGWSLLKDVTRSDDGKLPYRVKFDDNSIPVRYIRIRVIGTDSKDAAYSNISEVSFWYR